MLHFPWFCWGPNSHIGEIRKIIFMFENCGLTKHIKAPARVKDEFPNLRKK